MGREQQIQHIRGHETPSESSDVDISDTFGRGDDDDSDDEGGGEEDSDEEDSDEEDSDEEADCPRLGLRQKLHRKDDENRMKVVHRPVEELDLKVRCVILYSPSAPELKSCCALGAFAHGSEDLDGSRFNRRLDLTGSFTR